MRKPFSIIRAKTAAYLCAALAILFCAATANAERAIYDYEIVNSYPHDPEAFTQGLFFLKGELYESTGLKGRSSIRRVDVTSGEVRQLYNLPDNIFGEGITNWKNRIVQVTWRSQTGFVYDLKSFKQKKKFTYPGEGWGVTQDGHRLIMSDGTAQLRFLNPSSLAETGRVTVTSNGKAVHSLNELEYIDGEVFANVWRTDLIVRIDPETGIVRGVIDLRGLRESLPRGSKADVLNGIAFDPETRRIFVTGKLWPTLFEIKLIERKQASE